MIASPYWFFHCSSFVPIGRRSETYPSRCKYFLMSHYGVRQSEGMELGTSLHQWKSIFESNSVPTATEQDNPKSQEKQKAHESPKPSEKKGEHGKGCERCYTPEHRVGGKGRGLGPVSTAGYLRAKTALELAYVLPGLPGPQVSLPPPSPCSTRAPPHS